ncbi:glycosyltransferase family A protein [Streptomyces sp. W16]|uniref:glycosyltransferase family 2 protein n=1 Tax=Streptomyces sp. W16 TaxID=3076631 RepID=UPI00295C14B3|nr:glycosyltransferase family A protein [Streptomyces sp. W16]MDV9170719.1 glycosyltransferase family A protein [Streptomyces sp. W16]
MTPTPRFSVICPTYNRSRAITRTLDSVRAQSFPDWELLVISDGSTDDTDKWVRAAATEEPRIRLVRTDRHGHPSGPRTIGLTEARGEFAAYIDHDDEWRADHLRVLSDAFEAGAELVATGCERRTAAGELASRSDVLEVVWHPEIQLLGPMFEPSRVAHRLPLAEKAGGWRAGAGLEDWDLWLRMTDLGLRFTTVHAHTTTLLDDSSTRRHRTARRHRLPLAVFDNARLAHDALRRLRGGEHDEEFRRAYVADTTEWYERMATTPEFVLPAGWRGELRHEITRRAVAPGEVWPDLVLLPEQRDRFVLAQLLWCADADHARRVASLSARVQRRQLALAAKVAGVEHAAQLT